MNKTVNKAVAVLAAAVIFTLLSAVCVSAQESTYVPTVYNERNGLPTGEANDIIQTSDGYIWIGSYGGLVRYDGTKFRNYSIEGKISSSIRSLFEDSSGRLWIGTNDMGVYVFENDKFTKIKCEDETAFLCIRDFCEAGDGTVYCASNSGLAKIDGEKIVPFEIEELKGDIFYSCMVDNYGRIWAALGSGKCAVVSPDGSARIFSSSDIFDDTEIYCLTGGKDREIYLGTSGNRLAQITLSSESLDLADMKITYLSTGNVTTHNKLRMTDSGNLLICGLHGFGILYEDGSFQEFTQSDKAASVNSAALDYEGNYWLASSAYGLIKYTNGCFNSFNGKSGLEGVAINTLVCNNDCYYVGLDNGLLIFDSSWNQITNELTEMLDGIRVRSIIADSKGRVWLASYSDNPVICYDLASGEMTAYTEENGMPNLHARVLFELSDGSIAVGMQSGIAIISDGKITRTYTADDGLSEPQILCFYEKSDGTLLAGSDGGGIYELNGDTVSVHSFSEGLSEGVVLRITADTENDGAYFVSAGSSLYYFENGSFRKLSNLKKEAGSIFDIYDRDGKLWLFQNNGILCVNKQKLLSGEEEALVTYGFKHGLSGSLNANTWHWLSPDGSIYLATRNGICSFNFKSSNYSLPKLIINEISVDGQVYEHPQEINVGGDAQRITIDFAALSYADTNNISIAYQLVGFDKEEIVLSGEKFGEISYTNLPGGQYLFTYRVFDTQYPDISLSNTIYINKENKFYEKPVFWICIGGIFIVLAFLAAQMFFRLKLRRIKRRQNEYRSLVEQTLQTFAKTIDAKDRYTNGHSIRVAAYSVELARRMGMSDDAQERIYYIALLHDIGKIGIPDHILNKPGRLTDEEREIIQRHPAIGGKILENFTALDGAEQGAKYHHERFDGKGYCEHLAGKNIPKVARIIGVADSYDAMSSDRCYRKALSKEKIVTELKEGMGKQFDPDIVPHMLDMIQEGVVPVKAEYIEGNVRSIF